MPKKTTKDVHSESSAQDARFDEWALLELFGHSKIAGRVTAVELGGASFVRIDVPEIDGKQAITRYFSPSAIFSITPMTEQTVRSIIKTGLQPELISRYDVKRMLPALREQYPDEEY